MRRIAVRNGVILSVSLVAVIIVGVIVWAMVLNSGNDHEPDDDEKVLDKPSDGLYSLVDESCGAIDWSQVRDLGIKDGDSESRYEPPIGDSGDVKCSFVDTANRSKRHAHFVAHVLDSPKLAVESYNNNLQKVESLDSLASVVSLKGTWDKGEGITIAGKQDDYATTKGIIQDSNLVLEFESVIEYPSSGSRKDVSRKSLDVLSTVSGDLMKELRLPCQANNVDSVFDLDGLDVSGNSGVRVPGVCSVGVSAPWVGAIDDG